MIDLLRDWFGLAAVVIALGTTIYTWLTSRSRLNEKSLDDHRNRLDAAEHRIKELGTELNHQQSKLSRDDLELKKIDGRLDRAESHLSRVEGELEHLPDKDSHHRLELMVAEMAGDMKAMAEAQNATRNTVKRMEDHLMDGGRK